MRLSSYMLLNTDPEDKIKELEKIGFFRELANKQRKKKGYTQEEKLELAEEYISYDIDDFIYTFDEYFDSKRWERYAQEYVFVGNRIHPKEIRFGYFTKEIRNATDLLEELTSYDYVRLWISDNNLYYYGVNPYGYDSVIIRRNKDKGTSIKQSLDRYIMVHNPDNGRLRDYIKRNTYGVGREMTSILQGNNII